MKWGIRDVIDWKQVEEDLVDISAKFNANIEWIDTTLMFALPPTIAFYIKGTHEIIDAVIAIRRKHKLTGTLETIPYTKNPPIVSIRLFPDKNIDTEIQETFIKFLNLMETRGDINVRNNG